MINKNIGIITKPITPAGVTPLLNLTDILCSVHNKTYLITSINGVDFKSDKANLELVNLNYRMDTNLLFKFFKYVIIQFEISYNMIKSKKVNNWIFFFESNVFLLPLIISKIFYKNTTILLGASLKHTGSANKNFLVRFSTIPEQISFKLADNIILYSPNLVKYWELEKYNEKIIIAHRHFLDFEKFKITKKFNQRDNMVGFIGRLSEEKGIKNFLEAIKITKTENNLKFLIGGEGNYKDEMKKFLDENKLKNVYYVGWISHDDLPKYLNDLKLLVIPSYTEGLPNIMIESMACGTPVLANPVGSVTDVITDEVDSFLLKNNSPEKIAVGILKSIYHQNLINVSFNANKVIKRYFTKEKVINKWAEMLKSY